MDRRRRHRKYMFIVVVLAAFTVAGYHYSDYLPAYGEDWALNGNGAADPPPPAGEPEEEPKPEPEGPEPEETQAGEPGGGGGSGRYPPPPGELLHIADGDYLLALVTKQTYLGKYAPDDLAVIPSEMIVENQRQWNYYLRREALGQLRRLWEDARGQGINLKVISAYRCYDTQQRLFDDYAARHGEERANRFSARPGQSEHQLGTAVDFGGTWADKTEAFAGTPEGTWLAENAHKYGFALSYPKDSEEITGYIYEPWHYRYIGVANALAWKESNLVLSEFLAAQPQYWLNSND